MAAGGYSHPVASWAPQMTTVAKVAIADFSVSLEVAQDVAHLGDDAFRRFVDTLLGSRYELHVAELLQDPWLAGLAAPPGELLPDARGSHDRAWVWAPARHWWSPAQPAARSGGQDR